MRTSVLLKPQEVVKMNEAYKEYFNNLEEGEEALSFAEFVACLS